MNGVIVKKITDRLSKYGANAEKTIILRNGNQYHDGLDCNVILLDQENSIGHAFRLNNRNSQISMKKGMQLSSFSYDDITEIITVMSPETAQKIAKEIATEIGVSEERITAMLKTLESPLKPIVPQY